MPSKSTHSSVGKRFRFQPSGLSYVSARALAVGGCHRRRKSSFHRWERIGKLRPGRQQNVGFEGFMGHPRYSTNILLTAFSNAASAVTVGVPSTIVSDAAVPLAVASVA